MTQIASNDSYIDCRLSPNYLVQTQSRIASQSFALNWTHDWFVILCRRTNIPFLLSFQLPDRQLLAGGGMLRNQKSYDLTNHGFVLPPTVPISPLPPRYIELVEIYIRFDSTESTLSTFELERNRRARTPAILKPGVWMGRRRTSDEDEVALAPGRTTSARNGAWSFHQWDGFEKLCWSWRVSPTTTIPCSVQGSIWGGVASVKLFVQF